MAAVGFTLGLGVEPGMVAGEIVGRWSVRHALDDFLAREGGHIGSGVLRGAARARPGTPGLT